MNDENVNICKMRKFAKTDYSCFKKFLSKTTVDSELKCQNMAGNDIRVLIVMFYIKTLNLFGIPEEKQRIRQQLKI